MLENLVHQVILAKKKRGRREASGSVWSQAGQRLDGMGAQVPDSQAPRPAGEGQLSKRADSRPQRNPIRQLQRQAGAGRAGSSPAPQKCQRTA